MEWKKTKTNTKTKTKDHLGGGVKQVGVEEDGVSGLKFHKDVRVTLASLVNRFY